MWSVNDALSKIIDVPEVTNGSVVEVKEVVVNQNLQAKESKGFFSKAINAVKEAANQFTSFISKSIESVQEDQIKIQEDLANKELDDTEKQTYITFDLIISDQNTGENIIKSKQLLLNRKTLKEVDKPLRIDNFAFISFDFGKEKLTSDHHEILKYVNEILTPNSQVSVLGYSDRIGSDKINYNLSGKRANEVSKAINSKNIKINTIGEKVLLYNNDLPEGRMYSRCVILEIETPIIIKGEKK